MQRIEIVTSDLASNFLPPRQLEVLLSRLPFIIKTKKIEKQDELEISKNTRHCLSTQVFTRTWGI